MSDTQKLQHIGFIMDGNRTWARQHGLPQLEGHRRGYDNAENIIEYCLGLDIPYISFWGLSDDNIKKRSEEEVSYLFDLLARGVKRLTKKAIKKNIRIHFVGNRELMRGDCLSVMDEATKKTQTCSGMQVIFALGYGGQDELLRAIKLLMTSGVDVANIGIQDIVHHMDTGTYPPPDIIIRTGGHMRHSGYFLFQSAYSEYAFSQKNWPEFDSVELDKILQEYTQRERKFGK